MSAASLYSRLSGVRPFVVAAVSITACVTAWCTYSALHDFKHRRRKASSQAQDTALNGHSDANGVRPWPEIRESQNLLHILYLIAEDQAKRDGYIHRGVSCNGCGMTPVRGIRYRCSNCIDFDLCEHCEATDSHHRTHLFYKIRIPIPTMGNPRHAQRPWYPGSPSNYPTSLPFDHVKKLQSLTGCKAYCLVLFANFSVDQAELEGIYEQFKCLASSYYPEDPWEIFGAISLQSYHASLSPMGGWPNLICDRIFNFYDTNHDNLVGFEEFLRGLSILQRAKSERLPYAFAGYDMDDDGFISPEDVMRMFGAYFALSQHLIGDLVKTMEDEVQGIQAAQNVINGCQPISTAFSAIIPRAIHTPRKDGSVLQVVEADEPSGIEEEILLPNEFLSSSANLDSFDIAEQEDDQIHLNCRQNNDTGHADRSSSASHSANEERESSEQGNLNGRASPSDREEQGYGDGASTSNIPREKRSIEAEHPLQAEFMKYAVAAVYSLRPTNTSNLPEPISSVDAESVEAKLTLAKMISEGISELVTRLFRGKARLSLKDLDEMDERDVQLLGAWLDIAAI